MALSQDELTEVTRHQAATGDTLARLDEAGEEWTVELSLPGSGARCLARSTRHVHCRAVIVGSSNLVWGGLAVFLRTVAEATVDELLREILQHRGIESWIARGFPPPALA